MQFLVLDEAFQSVDLVDAFESAIWTERYWEFGDFELQMAASRKVIELFKADRYLLLEESEHLMIIESIEVKTNILDGSVATIKGRSLQSILDRRIVWKQDWISGSLQGGIKKLLDKNIINPSDASRKIPNFIFVESKDPAITALKQEMQFTGDNLYTVISELCKAHKIGFEIVWEESDNTFRFQLIAGINRSYSQETEPYVVFSPSFENLLNSNYLSSTDTMKNVTLIAGEGEGNERKYETAAVQNSTTTGLKRRELFTDARDVRSKDDDNNDIPPATYSAQLKAKGIENLGKNQKTELFDGEAEPTRSYQYGKDFFMGDIVQIRNEYDMEMTTRVTEYIRVQDENGTQAYPTFQSTIEEGVYR